MALRMSSTSKRDKETLRQLKEEEREEYQDGLETAYKTRMLFAKQIIKKFPTSIEGKSKENKLTDSL